MREVRKKKGFTYNLFAEKQYLCSVVPGNTSFSCMFVTEISLWGSAFVACAVLVAMIALAFFDRQMLRRMLVIFGATVAQMAVSAAMLAGSIVVGGSMMSYQRNQQKPEALREDMFHQVRNLAQPLVMVVPMLYAGMLLGGVAALEALLVTLLLIATSFVANILAGLIALGIIKKDKVGR